jgi:hypothetical protein
MANLIDSLFPIRLPKTLETATVADTPFGDCVTSVSASSHWKPYYITAQTAFETFVRPYLYNLETFLVAPISDLEKACVEQIRATVALYTYAVDLPKRLFSTGNAGLTTANVDKQQPVDMGKFKVQAQAAVLAADKSLDALMAFLDTHAATEPTINALRPYVDSPMFRSVKEIQTHIQIDNSFLTYRALRPYIRNAYLHIVGHLPPLTAANMPAYEQLAPTVIAQAAFMAWLNERQTNVLMEPNGIRILSNMDYMNRTDAAVAERQRMVDAKIKATELDNALKHSALRRLLGAVERPNASVVRDGKSNVIGIFRNR